MVGLLSKSHTKFNNNKHSVAILISQAVNTFKKNFLSNKRNKPINGSTATRLKLFCGSWPNLIKRSWVYTFYDLPFKMRVKRVDGLSKAGRFFFSALPVRVLMEPGTIKWQWVSGGVRKKSLDQNYANEFVLTMRALEVGSRGSGSWRKKRKKGLQSGEQNELGFLLFT